MLQIAKNQEKTEQLKRENNLPEVNYQEISTFIARFWQMTSGFIDRGFTHNRILHDGLNIKRLAKGTFD